MKIYIFCFLIGLLFCMSSCSNFLDIEETIGFIDYSEKGENFDYLSYLDKLMNELVDTSHTAYCFLYIETPKPVYAGSIKLEYNMNELSFMEFKELDFFEKNGGLAISICQNQQHPFTINKLDIIFTLTGTNVSECVFGEGVLCFISFTKLIENTYQSIKILETKFIDFDENEIDVEVRQEWF